MHHLNVPEKIDTIYNMKKKVITVVIIIIIIGFLLLTAYFRNNLFNQKEGWSQKIIYTNGKPSNYVLVCDNKDPAGLCTKINFSSDAEMQNYVKSYKPPPPIPPPPPPVHVVPPPPPPTNPPKPPPPPPTNPPPPPPLPPPPPPPPPRLQTPPPPPPSVTWPPSCIMKNTQTAPPTPCDAPAAAALVRQNSNYFNTYDVNTLPCCQEMANDKSSYQLNQVRECIVQYISLGINDINKNAVPVNGIVGGPPMDPNCYVRHNNRVATINKLINKLDNTCPYKKELQDYMGKISTCDYTQLSKRPITLSGSSPCIMPNTYAILNNVLSIVQGRDSKYCKNKSDSKSQLNDCCAWVSAQKNNTFNDVVHCANYLTQIDDANLNTNKCSLLNLYNTADYDPNAKMGSISKIIGKNPKDNLLNTYALVVSGSMNEKVNPKWWKF